MLPLNLEIKRLDLLFRFNVPDAFALLLFSGAYVYVCRSVMSIFMLAGWFLLLLATVVFRLVASWRWHRVKNSISSARQVKRWHFLIQALLGISGIAWGVAGWMSQYSQNSIQQMFTAIALVFVVAGALMGFAVSIRCVLLVVLPAVIPWSVALFISQSTELSIMGVLALIFLALGINVAMILNRVLINSLRGPIDDTGAASSLIP